MSDSLSTDVPKSGATRMPLLENGNDPITEAVWLTSPTLGDVYRLKISSGDQTALFEEVERAGFSRHPAILADWRSSVPTVTLFGRGLGTPEKREQLVIEDRPITEIEMKEALDNFYSKSLRTPYLIAEGHAQRVWRNAAKGIPLPKPEERIQGRAIEVLRTKFTNHDLRAEPVTDDGRADIAMWARSYRRTSSCHLR